jgi:glyoxylase-like metal-dependent hydrolase (beta-lactamase superfamily II)
MKRYQNGPRLLAALTLAILAVSAKSGERPATACALERIEWTARGENYEPAQSLVPGSDPRHVSDDRVRVTWSPATGEAELAWQKQTHYPFAKRWRYTETYSPDDSAIEGRGGFRPATDDGLPPARRMMRFAELWLRVPALWPDERQGVELAGASWQRKGPEERPDSASARELNPPKAASDHVIEYFDWREVNGLSVPGRIERRVGGELIRRERLTDWDVERRTTPLSDCRDPATDTHPEGAGWAERMLHWLLRRQAMGAGSAVDMSQPIKLENLADGIHHIRGSSHHGLVIETGDSLVLADASLYPSRSYQLLERLESRFPDQPISHVVLTHHHHDHSGGLLPLVRTGATLVVSSEAGTYFRDILDAHGVEAPSVTEAGPGYQLPDLNRTVELLPIPNSHAAGMLAVHIPDADHVFNADLYSPGRETQHPLWAEEFYRALEWHGLDDVSLSGGHGKGTEPFRALEDWVNANGTGVGLEP